MVSLPVKPCPLSPAAPHDPCNCVICHRGRQRCHLCWKFFDLGDHIKKEGGGWCHALCPEAARGVLVVAPAEVHDPDAPAPGEYAPAPLVPLAPETPPRRVLTDEQREIVSYQAAPGRCIRVAAVAGSGKTTTCVKLAERLLREDPAVRILYLVFNNKAREEAVARFPTHVHVSTSHALAQRRAWPKPLEVAAHLPKLDVVIEAMDLVNVADSRWGLIAEVANVPATDMPKRRRLRQQLQKKARAEARYVLKTLLNFLWSDNDKVDERHVFWKARVPAEKRCKRNGSSAQSQTGSGAGDATTEEIAPLLPDFYAAKAQQIFDEMRNPATQTRFPQTHDGYMKLFQLNGEDLGAESRPPCTNRSCSMHGEPLQERTGRFGRFLVCPGCDKKNPGGYDVIITDEAQDQTPAQAAAFWTHATAATYLVGDARQRIYRWRGAREDFEGRSVVKEFRLSETWRFGSNIADAVNTIMGCMPGDQRVIGRNKDEGEVVWPGGLPRPRQGIAEPEVIITRSNKGMFDALKERVVDVGADSVVPTWAFVDHGMQHLVNPRSFDPYLKLRRGETIRLHGEDFESWEELKEYIEDEGDTKAAAMVEIVERYGEDVTVFVERIAAARVDDWRGATFAMITAHKSKGLEFPCVTFGDDYHYPITDEDTLLPPQRMQRPFWQEELNIIYVAMSRAQRTLRLSAGLARFLEMLGHQNLNQSAAAPVAPQPDVLAKLDELRLGDETRWKLFEEEAQTALQVANGNGDGVSNMFCVSVEAVPWPRGAPDNVLSFHEELPDDEIRRLLQLAMLRFHPDKFLARWWVLISESDRERGSRLHQQLAETTRNLLRLRKDWLGPSSPFGMDEECVICLELAPRQEDRLCTKCCRQPICSSCYREDSGRLSVPKCPYCRRESYEVEPVMQRRRRARAEARARDAAREGSRSRSPRRAGLPA